SSRSPWRTAGLSPSTGCPREPLFERCSGSAPSHYANVPSRSATPNSPPAIPKKRKRKPEHVVSATPSAPIAGGPLDGADAWAGLSRRHGARAQAVGGG